MNSLLVAMNFIGYFLIVAAGFRVIEASGKISMAARLFLIAIIFLAIFASIEVLAARTEMRPGQTIFVFSMGLYAVWRVFGSAAESLLTRQSFWHLGSQPKI